MRSEVTIQTERNFCLEWSVASHPKQGEDVCGDLHLVKNYRDQVVVAVADGLGHGKEALDASRSAIQSLKSFTNQSLISMIHNCHSNIRHTRGVVMNLAVFDSWENTMSWIGIGNVEGILYRAGKKRQELTERILARGGVVGYMLPLLKASIVSITPGDTLLFATDGVDDDFEKSVDMRNSTDSIVGQIAGRHMKKNDDALILAARYHGIKGDRDDSSTHDLQTTPKGWTKER